MMQYRIHRQVQVSKGVSDVYSQRYKITESFQDFFKFQVFQSLKCSQNHLLTFEGFVISESIIVLVHGRLHNCFCGIKKFLHLLKSILQELVDIDHVQKKFSLITFDIGGTSIVWWRWW